MPGQMILSSEVAPGTLTDVTGSGRVESLNVGQPRAVRAKSGWSGIDKRPVAEPVWVSVPAAGRSGVAGDAICDTANHGGARQAVYAFAREDLDWWEEQLRCELSSGTFGENLTTVGLDVTGARLGERWRVGETLVLEVTGPRVPCSTFAVWMGRQGWLKAFVGRARPGAYLQVVIPGEVRPGDAIEVVHRPAHTVDIGLAFRAITGDARLLPQLLAAGDDLGSEMRELVEAGHGFAIDDESSQ